MHTQPFIAGLPVIRTIRSNDPMKARTEVMERIEGITRMVLRDRHILPTDSAVDEYLAVVNAVLGTLIEGAGL